MKTTKLTQTERAIAHDLSQHAGAIAANRKEAARYLEREPPRGDLALILYETNVALARAAKLEAEEKQARDDLSALAWGSP